MILSFDYWTRRHWGLGFTLWFGEDDMVPRMGFEWQVKMFGRDWGTGSDRRDVCS